MFICTATRSGGSPCGAENPNGAQLCQACGASLQRALEIHDPGTVVGTYRIVKMIGFGGFGAVYEAEHTQKLERVALKETFDPNNIRGFQREFAVLQHLSHTQLPSYYEMFESQGNGYLVMELVEGQSLEDVLNRQTTPLPESQVLGFALQMCEALDYLHSQNPIILHRDIKPANIRLTGEGRIKLVDFGLLKQGNRTTRVTIRGMGTVEYAPSEQYGGPEHTDACSDIYSLGATLYHLLTNTAPLPATIRSSQDPDPLEHPQKLVPSLSSHTSHAILTAMALKQQYRYHDVKTFKQALMGSSPLHAQQTTRVSLPQQPGAIHAQQTHRVSASPPAAQHTPAQSVVQQTLSPPAVASTGTGNWWDSTWWMQWIVATAIGGALGRAGADWLLASAIQWPVFGALYDAMYTASGKAAYHMLSGMIGGAVVGTAQWLLLHRRLPHAFWWIAATAIGWAIGWAFGGAVAIAAFYQVMIGATVGACAGIAQWQVLQRHMPGIVWWVLASAIGWAAGWTMNDFLFGIGHGAVAGAMTGVILLWLLRRASFRP